MIEKSKDDLPEAIPPCWPSHAPMLSCSANLFKYLYHHHNKDDGHDRGEGGGDDHNDHNEGGEDEEPPKKAKISAW